MGYVFYSLFMACCMFVMAACGLMIAISMWRRSVNECERECCKDD